MCVHVCVFYVHVYLHVCVLYIHTYVNMHIRMCICALYVYNTHICMCYMCVCACYINTHMYIYNTHILFCFSEGGTEIYFKRWAHVIVEADKSKICKVDVCMCVCIWRILTNTSGMDFFMFIPLRFNGYFEFVGLGLLPNLWHFQSFSFEYFFRPSLLSFLGPQGMDARSFIIGSQGTGQFSVYFLSVVQTQ